MTTEAVERDTSKADMAIFIALVRFMVEAAEKLDFHWGSDSQLDPDITNNGYPFDRSFDEVFIDMQNWLRLLENPVDRHGVVVSVLPSPSPESQPDIVMVKWDGDDALTREIYAGWKNSPGRVRTGLQPGCVYDDEEEELVEKKVEPLKLKWPEGVEKLVPVREHKITKKFTEGTRVRFVRFHEVPIHPFTVIIPVGAMGTVKEIQGDEGTEAWVTLDTYNEHLDEWDNAIIFSMEDQENGVYMDKELEVAEEGAVENVVTEFRCPSCHSADLVALAPQLYVYEVKGVRHGRVITTDSVNVVDHPDQDVQLFECLDCQHKWADNDAPMGWCEDGSYKFAEEDYSRAYDKLCRAMQDADNINGIRWAAESLAKAAKALRG
jgi:hypothetical protein